MPQVLRSDNIPSTFTITGALTAQMVVSVSSPLRATIGGQQYASTSNLSLNLATTGAGGLDAGSAAVGTYYLHLVSSSGSPVLVASLSTAPSGFSASKQIARIIVGSNSLSTIAILSILDETSYQIETSKDKKNYIINGNFDYWQRKTTGNSAGGNFVADRMRPTGSTSGTVAISRQSFAIGQTDVPNNPTYFHRWTQTGVVSTSMSLAHRVEDVKTLANKTATFSLWLKSNSGTPTVTISVGQNFGSTGSSSVVAATKSVVLSTSWQKYQVTLTLPSISGKTVSGGDDHLYVALEWPISGTWDVDTAQWMLNEGPVAAPFSLAGGDMAGELAKCQRYYTKTYATEIAPGTATSEGVLFMALVAGNNDPFVTWQLPVEMRIVPTGRAYNPATGTIDELRQSAGTNRPCTSQWVGRRQITFRGNFASTSLLDDEFFICHAVADAEL